MMKTYDAPEDVADCEAKLVPAEVVDEDKEEGGGGAAVWFPRFPTVAFGLNARVVLDARAHSMPPIIWLMNVGSYQSPVRFTLRE